MGASRSRLRFDPAELRAAEAAWRADARHTRQAACVQGVELTVRGGGPAGFVARAACGPLAPRAQARGLASRAEALVYAWRQVPVLLGAWLRALPPDAAVAADLATSHGARLWRDPSCLVDTPRGLSFCGAACVQLDAAPLPAGVVRRLVAAGFWALHRMPDERGGWALERPERRDALPGGWTVRRHAALQRVLAALPDDAAFVPREVFP